MTGDQRIRRYRGSLVCFAVADVLDHSDEVKPNRTMVTRTWAGIADSTGPIGLTSFTKLQPFFGHCAAAGLPMGEAG